MQYCGALRIRRGTACRARNGTRENNLDSVDVFSTAIPAGTACRAPTKINRPTFFFPTKNLTPRSSRKVRSYNRSAIFSDRRIALILFGLTGPHLKAEILYLRTQQCQGLFRHTNLDATFFEILHIPRDDHVRMPRARRKILHRIFKIAKRRCQSSINNMLIRRNDSHH